MVSLLAAGWAVRGGHQPVRGVSAEEGAHVRLDPALPFQLYPAIYIYDAVNGGVRRVLDQKGFSLFSFDSYDWSADGAWIVSGSQGNPNRLVVVSSDGRQRRDLEGQAWSVRRQPDGSFRVHMRIGDFDAPEFIARLDPATLTLEPLVQASADVTLSPDGRYAVASVFGPPGTSGLQLTDLATGETRMLARGSYHQPVWSPDGLLVAAQDHEMESYVVVFDLGGNLVARHRSAGQPAVWSPDSAAIATSAFEGGPDASTSRQYLSVFRLDAPGAELRLYEAQQPDWSPDGARLAFVRDGQLWQAEVATGVETRLLAPALPVIEEPRWSPDGKLLAFRAGRSFSELRTIDVGTGAEAYVGLGFEPSWAPDGERIAFLHVEGGLGFAGALYTMRPDGTAITPVAEVFYSDAVALCAGDSYDWSPDGQWLAYWSDGEGRPLAIAPADGSRAPLPLAVGNAPTWSGDGRALAFAATRSGPCNVYALPVSGGNPTLLAEGARNPEWSPDGRYIVAQSLLHDGTSLTLLSPDEPGFRQDLGPGSSAAWSPDSRSLAYFRQDRLQPGVIPPPFASRNAGSLVVYCVDAPAERPLEVRVEGQVRDIAWSPDGSRLAYSLSEGLVSQIYVLDLVNRGAPRLLTQGDSPSWSPDGRSIVFARPYGP